MIDPALQDHQWPGVNPRRSTHSAKPETLEK
jgi:hypothetical protein